MYLPNSVATAAAVAANKLKTPVRLWVPLEDNMRMLGKRNPYFFNYKVMTFFCCILELHLYMNYVLSRLDSTQKKR